MDMIQKSLTKFIGGLVGTRKRLNLERKLKNFEITFHLKHIKWKEYNELYQRYRKEKNKEQRAVLRIGLMRARNNISKTKSELISNIFLEVKV